MTEKQTNEWPEYVPDHSDIGIDHPDGGKYYEIWEESSESFWFSRRHYFDSLAKAEEFAAEYSDDVCYISGIIPVDEQTWEDAQDAAYHGTGDIGDQVVVHKTTAMEALLLGMEAAKPVSKDHELLTINTIPSEIAAWMGYHYETMFEYCMGFNDVLKKRKEGNNHASRK